MSQVERTSRAPFGSVGGRAAKHDVSNDLSNVLFNGIVARVREHGGGDDRRYSYDVRVQLGSSEATRTTVTGATPNESHSRGAETLLPEFHPGDLVSVYRASRSQWIIVGRNRTDKQEADNSQAMETRGAALSLTERGFLLAGANPYRVPLVAQGIKNDGDAVEMMAANGGADAGFIRVADDSITIGESTGIPATMSLRQGRLSLESSGPHPGASRLSIPVLVSDSYDRPQKRVYTAAGSDRAAAADAPGLSGSSGPATVGNHGSHTHDLGDLKLTIDINGFLGQLDSIRLADHMVAQDADLDTPSLAPAARVVAPETPTVPVAIGITTWVYLGRNNYLNYARFPPGTGEVILLLLGGSLTRGQEMVSAIKGCYVTDTAVGDNLQGLNPGTAFPDLEDVGRRQRMMDVGALRVQSGHLIYNDAAILSEAALLPGGGIYGRESAATFAPALPGLVIDDLSDGTQRVVSDADVTYHVLGIAISPLPNPANNEVVAPDTPLVLRYLWSAQLHPGLQVARPG